MNQKATNYIFKLLDKVSFFDKVGKFGTSLKLNCSVNSELKNLKLGTSIIQSIA